MKLLENTTNRITKDGKNKWYKNMPRLEITEVALVHCSIFINNYQHDSRVFYTLVPNNAISLFQAFKS